MARRAQPVVAIDGPAGAGKSTAARMVADRLGFVLVDTGALYRGVALRANERGISWDDAAALGELTQRLDIGFDAQSRLTIDGIDRSDDIRTPEISRGASAVSRHPEVRDALLGLQRRLGEKGGVVLEGRDIGTVVFPDAEIKVFLTASPSTRARRRVGDLEARGIPAVYDEVLSEIEKRDQQDSSRPVAPLKPADDALFVDSSDMAIDEVVDSLVALVKKR